MKDLGFASIPAVLQYIRYANHHSLDTQSAIVNAGIDPKVLENEDGRIRGELFQSLIKKLVVLSNNPLMGLHTSQFVQPGSYSVQGYIMMSCSTLEDAIKRIAPFEKLVGDMGVTSLHPKGQDTLVQWHCSYTDPLVRQHMIDNVLSSWFSFARWLANRESSAQKIFLEHPKPEQELVDKYHAFFNCTVEFGCRESGILIPNEVLNTPLRQPNKSLLSTLESHAVNQLSDLDEDKRALSIRVSQSIRAQLKSGVTSKELIARELNITSRTLQRKLVDEGRSYQELLNDIRLQMASDMLKSTQLKIDDIAYNLGFSDGRSFHRSFKSWTGETPGKFRDKFCR